jgi:molecular chaperone GrpE (heat shock protein)
MRAALDERANPLSTQGARCSNKAIFVVLGFSAILTAYAMLASVDPSVRLAALLGASILCATAMVVVAMHGLAESRLEAVRSLATGLLDVNARWSDLEAVRREHFKARTTFESLIAAIAAEAEHLREMQSELQRSVNGQRSIEEELLQQRQESLRQARAVEAWQMAAVEYVKGLERICEGDHEQLPPEVAKAYRKCADDFMRLMEPLGLNVIRPAAGIPFDERVHKIEGSEPAQGVSPGHIVRCVGWGFRLPATTIPARVLMPDAAESADKGEPAKGSLDESIAPPPPDHA